MNRIANKFSPIHVKLDCISWEEYFFRDTEKKTQKRESFTDIPDDCPDICSFCETKILGKKFIALSRTSPVSLICDECLTKLNRLSKIGEWKGKDKTNSSGDWDILKKKFMKHISILEGSDNLKQIVCTIMVSVCQRMAKIVSDNTIDINMEIAIVGDTTGAKTLFESIGDIVGVPVQPGTKATANQSLDSLKNSTNRDPLFDKLGLLIFRDGYCSVKHKGVTIYRIKKDSNLPNNIVKFYVKN